MVSCSSACASRPRSGPARVASAPAASGLMSMPRLRASVRSQPASALSRSGANTCRKPRLRSVENALQPDVDLVRDQQQAGRGVGILDVRQQRLEVGRLDVVDRLADDQTALGHHRQRARGGERRADAALLEVEDVVVEGGARRPPGRARRRGWRRPRCRPGSARPTGNRSARCRPCRPPPRWRRATGRLSRTRIEPPLVVIQCLAQGGNVERGNREDGGGARAPAAPLVRPFETRSSVAA